MFIYLFAQAAAGVGKSYPFQTHVVEVDLIRPDEQQMVPMPIEGTQERMDYRIVVSRAEQRPQVLKPALLRENQAWWNERRR